MTIPLRVVVLACLVLLLLPSGVSALATYSGGQVVIDEPVNDDLFVSGGMIEINAPVESVIAAGGTITINAPVAGDAIAAGGTIRVNDRIGGKLVAAGGDITVNQEVGTNAVLTGGTVTLGKGATVLRDAMVSGGQVINAGQVAGNLTVRAQTFDNRGTAGNLDVQLADPGRDFSRIFSIFGIIFTLGMLILGLVLLHFLENRFLAVEEEVRESALVKTLAGFFAIIIAFILLVLVSITVVLLPLALIFWAAFFTGLLLSTLFVSLALGRIIARYLKWEAPSWQLFILGFVILNLVFRIPVAGIIVLLISVSLGFAAFFHAIYQKLDELRGVSGGG
ncbi:MAG: hypothetical protein MIO88_00130 [Methanoregulaceae archaeon]|nr:hypothetical protein [Methanoregulaceae archaeon]